MLDLFERIGDGVFTLGYRMLGDYQSAEDLVQETFIQAGRRINQYQGRGSLEGWLYRIAYRKAIEMLRRRRDTPTPPYELEPLIAEQSPSAEAIALERALARILDGAMLQLPLKLRAAFFLRDVEGLPTAAVAEALGIGESAVKMRLKRARNELRTLLKEHL